MGSERAFAACGSTDSRRQMINTKDIDFQDKREEEKHQREWIHIEAT